jgi:hypothetical protein
LRRNQHRVRGAISQKRPPSTNLAEPNVNLLIKRRPPIRNRIELEGPTDLRCWTRALDVPPADLKAIIAKVGNSVAAVRKEIGRRGARL